MRIYGVHDKDTLFVQDSVVIDGVERYAKELIDCSEGPVTQCVIDEAWRVVDDCVKRTIEWYDMESGRIPKSALYYERKALEG